MARRNRPSRPPRQNRGDSPRQLQERIEIAQAAARLVAEGLTDLHAAKRKALHQLGLADAHPLPSDAEVTQALRLHQGLFMADEHAQHLRFLRATALELMWQLDAFRPYLTGSVLDGTAGRYSAIDLLLFADSAKDVEIFLLNETLAFRHGTPRDDRVEAVFVLEDEEAGVTANLVVLRPEMERVVFHHRDGRTRERVQRAGLQSLLAGMAKSPETEPLE